VLRCAVHVDGPYGIKDLYVGLPVVIGEKGIERVVELELIAAEKDALAKSAEAVKGLIEACKKLEPKLA
jgi:malate dehydrogenase